MNFSQQQKKKAITFSYDDGVTQDFRLVELLNKYGLKCTFNLNSQLLAHKGTLIRNGLRIAHYKIHPDDVKSLYEGHEVAVHTLTHPNLTGEADETVEYQVEEDRKKLSQIVGYEVTGMAYPCGGVNNDDRVAEIIKAKTGVEYARTITPSYSFDLSENMYRFNPTLHIGEAEKLFQLAEEFISMKPDTPKVFYIWGHSYEFDIYDEMNWDVLERFCQLISGKSDIYYGTNKDVFTRLHKI